MRLLPVALTSIILSPQGLAAGTASSETPVSGGDPLGAGAVLELVLGLFAVIALILLLAWLVKRVNVLPGQRTGMQVVAVLPLGQRERAVLVQVGERQLLLGVCASQVSLLQSFDTPVIEPRRAPEGAFSRRLQDVMRQRGGASLDGLSPRQRESDD